MRMIAKIGLLLCIGVVLPSYSSRQDQYLHTDNVSSHLTETTHVFHCEEIRATLTFAEHLHPNAENIPLVDRWRITLSAISVSGRTIPAEDELRLGRQFNSFAWIERVVARCARFNRSLEITVTGMMAEDWATFGEGRIRERPRPTSIKFTVAEDGSISLS